MNFNGHGMLVASNHASYIDPPIIGTSFHRRLWYLARRSLFERSVFFAALIRSVNAIPISRERLDITTMRRVKSLCEQGEWVLIFPEGTRTEDGTLQPGLAGVGLFADKIGADIIPVYHEGAYESWSRHMKFPRPKKIRVNIGSPIKASRWNGLPKGKERYKNIADDIMIAIHELRDELHGITGKNEPDIEV
jgi:1-acyl-sn-glycerol-3-phosphate acyltransferase